MSENLIIIELNKNLTFKKRKIIYLSQYNDFLKKEVFLGTCRNCLFIRYFLIAVFFIIAFGLIFTDKVNYLSIINPLNFSYFVLLIGFLIFLIKLFAYVKKSFFLNQSNKVGYFSRKSSKSMSRKKID